MLRCMLRFYPAVVYLIIRAQLCWCELCWCGMQETIDIAVLEMIADAVVNCDKELNLMSMAIEDAGLKALSQVHTTCKRRSQEQLD